MLLPFFTASLLFFFFKEKTAYELRISDWSSDVCSSDLAGLVKSDPGGEPVALEGFAGTHQDALFCSFAGAAYDRQRRRDADRAGIAHDEDAEAGDDRKSVV